MVVPDSFDYTGIPKPAVVRVFLLLGPFFSQHDHIVGIPIDVVTKPNPELGLELQN
jgi:hypothetical protein